jgi:hypothetical protein
LKIFYPQNNLDASGVDGWFTSTPYGAVDIVPIEADQTVLYRYKVIVFLGWNTFNEEDMTRLTEFVKKGGTLILTAAHLNAELAPDKKPVFPKDNRVLERLLGEFYRECTEKLVVSTGAGKTVYFPQALYPADPAITKEYTAAIKEAATKTNEGQQEKGWIVPDDRVGFTVWDKDGRRTLYLLNIDWKSDQDTHTAKFQFGPSSFTVNARRGMLETIHCTEGLAIMPGSNTTDVLNISRQDKGWRVTIQTTEPDEVRILRAFSGAEEKKQLATPGIHEIVVSQ